MTKLSIVNRVERRTVAKLAWFVVTQAISVFAFVSGASGTVIVDETFDEPGASVGNTANNPLDVAWGGIHNASLSIVSDAAGIGSGNALAVGTSSTFPGIGASFPKVDLAVGESVTLSFDFRFTALPGATTEGPRITLESNTSPTGTYLFEVGSGGTDGDGFIYYPKGQFAGSGGTSIPTVGSPAMTIDDKLTHVAWLEVTRTALGVDLVGTMDGNVYTGSDHTSGAFFDFDHMEFGEGDFAANVRIDNVTVATTPEPPSLVLLALGGFALLVVRARRRLK